MTLASRNQIVLKGCKAWLLCGEKVGPGPSSPPSMLKPEEQEPIEVKAPVEPVPKATTKPTPVIEAAREAISGTKPRRIAPMTVGTRRRRTL